MASVFSIDEANANSASNVFRTGPGAVPPPVAGVTAATGASGATGPIPPVAQVSEIPPGAGRIGAGTAPGVVPTVAQVRAGQPIVQTQPLPPQQQGVAPAPVTLADRAQSIIDRVGQGLGRMVGAARPASTPLPTGIDRNFASVVTPSAQAAIDADAARRAAAPNVFQLRKQNAIAKNY